MGNWVYWRRSRWHKHELVAEAEMTDTGEASATSAQPQTGAKVGKMSHYWTRIIMELMRARLTRLPH